MARRTVYVGSYTGFERKGQLGWVGTANAGKGITIFNFDEDTGTLSPTGAVVEQVSRTYTCSSILSVFKIDVRPPARSERCALLWVVCFEQL
jgi:hypothetical protein